MQTEAQAAPGRLPGVPAVADAAAELVLTLTVAGQLCGVPVLAVRDILAAQAITRVPLAPPEPDPAIAPSPQPPTDSGRAANQAQGEV